MREEDIDEVREKNGPEQRYRAEKEERGKEEWNA